MDDLTYASATALARAIAKKQISSEEVVRAHLQRIEAVNPELNAVVQLAAEGALEGTRKADAMLVGRHEDLLRTAKNSDSSAAASPPAVRKG